MFAYLQKMYKYNMINLYTDDYNDDEYLFNLIFNHCGLFKCRVAL